ncbi:MAG: histidine kinase [Saprospirales bacterium]|nr:histidine kinase [Saprospirales bacterium]
MRYYAIRQDQSGRIWASTRQGLVEWAGDAILPAHQGYRALQQRINDIELLPDTSLALCPRGHGVVFWKPGRVPLEINTGQALSLPHDSANVALEFVCLHFRSNSQIPFAFRLRNSADEAPWTYTTDRRVNFPNLSPGDYRFEVKAQTESGVWSPVTALDITIRPPWWATWWARAGAALLLALLAYAAYRYRIRQINQENRLREEMQRLERAALQAQMNPHFIFNCLNSIQHFILENESDAAVLYLAKFARLVRGTLDASVAGAVSLEDEVKMLGNYLALEQLRFKKVFDYRITVAETLDAANTELPPLIIQPFVENAVLHGMKNLEKDGRIGVTFRREAGFLCIEVQDNGLGMHAAGAQKRSLGRSITQRRLELLQQQNERGAISVQYLSPEDGVGTLVSIRLPFEKIQKYTSK